MDTALTKGAVGMNAKRVSISSKRQITIPQKFYALLGFDDEAECIVRGKELLAKFKEAQKKVRPAVEAMLAEASEAASSDTGFETYEDVFGTEE